ncbi:MAG: VWA domain-containing protein [Vicinamibacteria bacterium]|nr:VWA domain-containing protein [Vicinamibacteria bacterium]
MTRFFLCVLLIAGIARHAAPQETTSRRLPRFEAGVDVTQLNVSVMRGRRFITGLSRDDFAIFEDGARQQISLFIPEELPISLVLMLDASSSMKEKLASARAAAKRFVKTLREEDLAEVVQFNERATTLQGYTSEQAALEGAIDKTEASGATALHDALYVALKDLARQKKSGELRRWAIMIISDGEDTNSLITEEQVIALARQTEIHVYAVSLGLHRPGEPSKQSAYLLSTLAEDTGGRIYFANSVSELDHLYEIFAEELRTQYSMGYISNNSRRDGEWRSVVVRLPGRDAVELRHRIGYYAPAR